MSKRNSRGFLLVPALIAVLTYSRASAAEFDLSTATLADIHAATDAGALSSEKLVAMYLKRIEAYDKQGPKIKPALRTEPAPSRPSLGAQVLVSTAPAELTR